MLLFASCVFCFCCCSSPDDKVFRQLAKAYSFAHPLMHQGEKAICPGDMEPFKDGITNGAAWYNVAGGMQDYNYFTSNCFEITVEMGCSKFPRRKYLKRHWQEHKPALLAFMEQVGSMESTVSCCSRMPVIRAQLGPEPIRNVDCS